MNKCYKCYKEEVSGFVNIKTGNFLESRDTGIQVYMCKKCIDKLLKDNAIDNFIMNYSFIKWG